MATKTFKVALSLDNPRIIQSGINVHSFDKQSIKITIELTKNSQVYQIPTDAQIKISLLKLARQEQKIILDVPFTSADSIDWVVPDYLDGYQGEVRVGVYLIVGTENIDVGYFNITSSVSDIDSAAEEFTESVLQGWAIEDLTALLPKFQEVIDETTGKDVISAPEIILARNGEVDLKTRLDKEKQEVTAQLAQIAININNFKHLVVDGDWTTAFQTAIDTNKPIKIPQGEYIITDSLRLYQNTIIIGDYNSALTYSKAKTKINFRPTTYKDLFVLDSVPESSYVQGIQIEGLAISGSKGNYVLNLPFMQSGVFKNIKVFGGFNYGILLDGYIDTLFDRCSFQGVANIHINHVRTSLLGTTTHFEKCYFSQGDLGLKVVVGATNSLNFNSCVFESLNQLADIENNNYVNFYNPYVEEIPRSNNSNVNGQLFSLGVNGKKNYPQGALNIVGGIIVGTILEDYDTATCFNVDYFRNVNVVNCNISRFNYLFKVTDIVDMCSLTNVYADQITFIAPNTSDYTKFNIIGGNFKGVRLDTSSPWSYLGTPNLMSEIYLVGKDKSKVERNRLFLDSKDNLLKYKDAKSNLRRMSFLESNSSTPTFGLKLRKGELIYNTNVGGGQPVGWVSQRFSRDTEANVWDGVTTAGSPFIQADTFWDFQVNDYVTLSKGMPSTTQQYKIIAKSSDNKIITLDTNATSSATLVNVKLPTHLLAPFGQQGVRTAAGNPNGYFTPYFIGEDLFDTANSKWFKAKGLTDADWIALN